MTFALLTTSFVAGLLTVLAPCVLPLLPVIVGGTAGTRDWRRPVVITLALAASVVLFTLILKASTALIAIPQAVWTTVSGGIVLIFGIVMVWPAMWESFAFRLGLSRGSSTLLAGAGQREGLLGAALGPVFSSCSPTYFVILATVLPTDFATGVVYLLVYAAGLAVVLTAVALLGQRFTAHVRWATDPHGAFRRGLGVLLIVVGLAVISGFDKTIETRLIDAGFGTTSIEEALLGRALPSTTSSTTLPTPDMTTLPILGRAPELAGLTGWLNSQPIESLNDLKGNVVLVDFWTYSCVNCIRTLPYIESWHERYANAGLVIIGVHAPEFQFERLPENVAKAVKDFRLKYPIAQDNDFATWRAYDNHYWPAKYLIDRDGNLRYTHFGEGKYDETERIIAELLGEQPREAVVPTSIFVGGTAGTPETYLGLARRESFAPHAERLAPDEWTTSGEWREEDERIVTTGSDATLRLRFTARQANLVIGGAGIVRVSLDGQMITTVDARMDVRDGVVTLDGERLYQLTNLKTAGMHEIELHFEQADISVYAWTFG